MTPTDPLNPLLIELMQGKEFQRAQRILSWEAYLTRYEEMLNADEVTLENVVDQFLTDAELTLQADHDARREHNIWQEGQYR